MPRKARSLYQGEYYHVLSRGNNRQILFHRQEDFEYYLQCLAKYKEKFGISLFHYCLMNNHVHLLLRGDKAADGISKMMHGLQLVYARYFNPRQQKTGHVFEDRFKHFHIESDSYLLECGRYIERNPVRAGIVRDAAAYPWSSYRYYAYGQSNPLILEDILYSGLGKSLETRQAAYRQYVETARAYELLVDQHLKERVLV